MFDDLQSGSDQISVQRARMVESQLRARGVHDERVLAAMNLVPRHEFVPKEFRTQAYADHPIPIDHGQTISQPFIVAVMLEHLRLQPQDSVLEIGTGSGYVTALLAELAGKVFSIERHAPLADSARELLAYFECRNVEILVGDGRQGLPNRAPFDAIIVSAAALEIPPALFAQLRQDGRMIIPVGPPEAQLLQLVRKQDDRRLITNLDACRFVPLLGGVDTESD